MSVLSHPPLRRCNVPTRFPGANEQKGGCPKCHGSPFPKGSVLSLSVVPNRGPGGTHPVQLFAVHRLRPTPRTWWARKEPVCVSVYVRVAVSQETG